MRGGRRVDRERRQAPLLDGRTSVAHGPTTMGRGAGGIRALPVQAVTMRSPRPRVNGSRVTHQVTKVGPDRRAGRGRPCGATPASARDRARRPRRPPDRRCEARGTARDRGRIGVARQWPTTGCGERRSSATPRVSQPMASRRHRRGPRADAAFIDVEEPLVELTRRESRPAPDVEVEAHRGTVTRPRKPASRRPTYPTCSAVLPPGRLPTGGWACERPCCSPSPEAACC